MDRCNRYSIEINIVLCLAASTRPTGAYKDTNLSALSSFTSAYMTGKVCFNCHLIIARCKMDIKKGVGKWSVLGAQNQIMRDKSSSSWSLSMDGPELHISIII